MNLSSVVSEQSTLRVGASPQEKLMRVADRYRRPMMRLLMEPFEASRNLIGVETLEMLFQLGMHHAIVAYLDRVTVGLDTTLRIAEANKMSQLLLEINAVAGNITRCDFTVECLMQFDVTNPEAVIFAEEHAAELVTAVTAETREAVNEIVQRMFVEGIPPKQAAPLIKQVVGLTEKQANAVVNLHQRILTSPGKRIYAGKTPIRVPKTGMSTEQLNRTLQKYSDKLQRQRAMNIARTETVKAANEGQMELWRQAQAAGRLPKVIKHEWIASPTERTCDICINANGEVKVVGELFSTGTTNPPAHPSCRCSTGLVLQ
jgi:SPP1 gp7 family putative phage head morphogenesis protein